MSVLLTGTMATLILLCISSFKKLHGFLFAGKDNLELCLG
uniref:Uncharacterized protein n=1 Tax=Anguilla anguilla TaxID=7936 RepID=A0A0E9PDE4_ANGAN